jgi:hypothetical protein
VGEATLGARAPATTEAEQLMRGLAARVDHSFTRVDDDGTIGVLRQDGDDAHRPIVVSALADGRPARQLGALPADVRDMK